MSPTLYQPLPEKHTDSEEDRDDETEGVENSASPNVGSRQAIWRYKLTLILGILAVEILHILLLSVVISLFFRKNTAWAEGSGDHSLQNCTDYSFYFPIKAAI